MLMKRIVTAILVTSLVTTSMDAARVRVRRGPAGRTHVTVTRGFPIRRELPMVVVRPGVTVRVAPGTYLAPVVFGAVVVASLPGAGHQVWRGTEVLSREDGWTDFTMNVDKRGAQILMQIDRGAAQVSFAEVVFENGDAQVVDFNDKVHRNGLYSLLDCRDGRKVDHVRIVAKSDTAESLITLHLAS